MNENEIAKILVNIFFKIHRILGPGLFESVYEKAICYELEKLHIRYRRQADIAVMYENMEMDLGFRADIIIEDKFIVEIKSIESLSPVHSKQLLTYLKLTNIKLGLLVNFNVTFIKNGINRIANNL
jgi:GxxExxY protein